MGNFCKAVVKLYPDKPLFVLGNGSGGLLATHMATVYKKEIKFAGLILPGCSFKRPGNSKFFAKVGDFALKMMPNRTGLFELTFLNVCKNKAVSNYLIKDPLIYHGKIYVGNLMQFMEVMEEIKEDHWAKYETPPLLIIQGECDKVADPQNAINFYEKTPTKDKELWYYKKLWNMFMF